MSALDKVKNKFQAARGHTKKVVGEVTNDPSLEADGKADQASGNLKQSGEHIKDAFKP